MAREQRLVETFVTLADTMVDDYDVIDFLQTLAERSVELLDIGAAGIMLADADGKLRHAACSSEQMRLVELFELQLEEGPCFDAYSQRRVVLCASAEEASIRWPAFAPHAQDAGFVGISAVPMRLRSQTIGSLNLFASTVGALDDEDVRVGQGMADIATIGILQERALQDSRTVSAQLQNALDSRVVIEQAKGIVAERTQVTVDAAFQVIRSFARSHNHRLSDTARQIIDKSLLPEQLGAARATGSGATAS